MHSSGALLRSHKHTIGRTGRSISRAVVGDILAWAHKSEADLPEEKQQREMARIGVLLDVAGMGKTSVARDVLLALETEEVSVLAVKADQQLAGLKTVEDLPSLLGLPTSLENAVARLSSEAPVVIIIDQIDALSLALSHDQRALDIILATVARLKELPNVRVLISCRTFDLHSDPRLRHFATCITFNLPLLDAADVRPFIEDHGLGWETLSSATRDLLQVPLHLDLFVMALERRANGSSQSVVDLGYGVTTLQDLYRLLWRDVIRRDEFGAPPVGERELAVQRLAECMTQARRTSAPQSLFSRYGNVLLEAAVRWLASVGIFVEAGNEWAFLHQTFIDYCAAKAFAESGADLCETILLGDQALFARSQMLQTIAYLRGSDHDAYLVQLQKLFAAPDLRQHLRALLRGWFGSLRDPDDGEWRLAQRLLRASPEREQLLMWMGHNLGWFGRLKTSLLPLWLEKEGEFLDGPVCSYLHSMDNLAQEELADILLPFVGRSDAWNQRLMIWLINVNQWQSPKTVALFEKTLANIIAAALRRGEKWHFGNVWSLKKLVEFDPAAGCRVVRLLLDGLLAVFRAHRNETKYPNSTIDSLRLNCYSLSDRLEVLNGSSAHDLFETLPKQVPEAFLEQMLPWLEDALEVLEVEENPHYLYHYRDDELYEFWYGSGRCIRHQVAEGISVALAQIATRTKSDFERMVARLSALEYRTPHQILVHTFQLVSDPLADEAALYLLSDRRRLELGDRGNFDSRRLITLIGPHLSVTRRDELQAFLVACSRDVKRWARGKRHLLEYRGEDEMLLLEAFPPDLLNEEARQTVRELRHKFPNAKADNNPSVFRSIRDHAALPLEKALKISDRAWLKIFRRTWEAPSGPAEVRDQERRRRGLSGALINSIIAQPERFWNLFNRLQANETCNSLALAHRQAFMEGFAGAVRPLEDHHSLTNDEQNADDDENQPTSVSTPTLNLSPTVREDLVSPFVAPVEWFFEVVRSLAPPPGLQGFTRGDTFSWAEARRHLGWNLEKHATHLPADLVDLLEGYASTLPYGEIDPENIYEKERERLVTNSAHDSGNALINHERGVAWRALMKVFDQQQSPEHEKRRWALLEAASSDPSPILRIGVIDELKFHVKDHRDKAIALFEKCVSDFPEVLRAGDTREFLYWALNGQFRRLAPYMEAMMAHVPFDTDASKSNVLVPEPEISPPETVIGEDALRELTIKWKKERTEESSIHDQECAKNGAELVCIAAISTKILEDTAAREKARSLADKCLSGPAPWRLAAASIGVHNLKSSEAALCLKWLSALVDDENEKVRDKVAYFFAQVAQGKVNLPDGDILDFAKEFAASRALLSGLEEWRDFLWSLCEAQPEEMLSLLEKSLANPYRAQSRFYFTEDWMRLALRVYTDQLCDPDWRARALNAFDQLMSENSGVAHNLLSEWDRR